MKRIFINSKQHRLKAGWRILIFVILFIVFSSITLMVRPLLGDVSKRDYLENYSLLVVALLAIGASVSTLLSRRFLDRKSFVSLGLRWSKQSFIDILSGVAISFLMAFLFYILLLSFGLIEFQGVNIQNMTSTESFDFVEFMSILTLGSLALLLLEHILVGYWEELVFRGYLFQNMTEGLGLTLSVIISCLIYGLIHHTNPNATLLSSMIIVGFGFLRIYGYLTTKMLWLSMGMHIGWNFFQGPIFGFAASGHKSPTLLTHNVLSEKEYLTGGEFGPEGSLLIIPVLILAIIAMKWYSNKFYPSEYKMNPLKA